MPLYIYIYSSATTLTTAPTFTTACVSSSSSSHLLARQRRPVARFSAPTFFFSFAGVSIVISISGRMQLRSLLSCSQFFVINMIDEIDVKFQKQLSKKNNKYK